MQEEKYSLGQKCAAEVVGTFLLVFFGCGAVHTAVLLGAQAGLWQVAVVWGIAIAIAIFTVGSVSGAHINPAITIAFAVWGKFPYSRVLPYCLSQFVGAGLAALVLFFLFSPMLKKHEEKHGVTRGEPGSEITAMCYGEYYPNPGSISTNDDLKTASEITAKLVAAQDDVSDVAAVLAEVLGTAILAFAVFAMIDPRNEARPGAGLEAFFIGLTVAILISVIAPLTQACFNPARDFGPRFVAYFAGWGEVAFPGPRFPGTFLVYLVAPIVGAIVGAGVYEKIFQPRSA